MKPVAWRNKREPSLVRSAPPHPDYVHLWDPLYGLEQCAAWIETQRNDVPATGCEFAAAIRDLK